MVKGKNLPTTINRRDRMAFDFQKRGCFIFPQDADPPLWVPDCLTQSYVGLSNFIAAPWSADGACLCCSPNHALGYCQRSQRRWRIVFIWSCWPTSIYLGFHNSVCSRCDMLRQPGRVLCQLGGKSRHLHWTLKKWFRTLSRSSPLLNFFSPTITLLSVQVSFSLYHYARLRSDIGLLSLSHLCSILQFGIMRKLKLWWMIQVDGGVTKMPLYIIGFLTF